MSQHLRYNHILNPTAQPEGNKRARNRLNTVLLTCPHGDVVNLSLTGMRTRSRRKPRVGNDPRPLVLSVHHEPQLEVTARKVWFRRSGLIGTFEVGFEFVNLTPEQSSALSKLARDCYDAEVLRPRE